MGIFTARVRSTREDNVFSLFTREGRDPWTAPLPPAAGLTRALLCKEMIVTYMDVGTVSRAAHEDPVRLAGLGHRGKEVWPLIVPPQNVRRSGVTVTPEKRAKRENSQRLTNFSPFFSFFNASALPLLHRKLRSWPETYEN